MDFAPAGAHAAFLDAVRSFVDERVIPEAEAIDRRDEFPQELIEEIGSRGWMGMPFSSQIGGAGVGVHAYADGICQLSRGSGSLGTIVAAHTSLASAMVDSYGDETQRERYLPALAAGDEIGAFALSEPDAGSDVAAMQTQATRDGKDYCISGQKQWTSNGSVADTLIVFAITDPDASSGGISSFVIRPNEDDGVTVLRTEDKIGDRGCPTAAIGFDDVSIPHHRQLGQEGAGFRQALETLNGGRITIAARSIGIAMAARDCLQSWLLDNPEQSSQIAEHTLADASTKIEAAELLMHHAADRRKRGESFVMAAAQAKLFASEVSRTVAGDVVDQIGTAAAGDGHPAERFYRDAKLNEIYEGTSEILKNTIASRH